MPISNTYNQAQRIISEIANVRFDPAYRDRYASLQELFELESSEKYQINLCDRGSQIVLVAPHGGIIEPGTSELTRALAGDKFSYYDFQGYTKPFDPNLHVSSVNFDCPQLIQLLGRTKMAITFHGCLDGGNVVFVGGLAEDRKQSLVARLSSSGIEVQDHPLYRGIAPRNICNSALARQGIQIELSTGYQKCLVDSNFDPKLKLNLMSALSDFIRELEVQLIATSSC